VAVEVVFMGLLAVLIGIGSGLTIIGVRKRSTPLLVSGITILAPVGVFAAYNLFFMVVCWTGNGCI
jgi:hypothetical protein